MNELTKMNFIATVQQLPKDDIEFVQTYITIMEDKITNLKKEKQDLIKYLEDEIKYLSQMTAQFIQLENKVTTIPEIKIKIYQELLDKVKEGNYE